MGSCVVTSTEANRSFSDLLNRVRYQRQSFDIKRGKEIVAKLVPARPALLVGDLEAFFKGLPGLGQENSEAFEKAVLEVRQGAGKARDPWG